MHSTLHILYRCMCTCKPVKLHAHTNTYKRTDVTHKYLATRMHLHYHFTAQELRVLIGQLILHPKYI